MWWLIIICGWYLPALIAFFVCTWILDRIITVRDIFASIVMSLLGWIAILMILYTMLDKYGDIIVFGKKE